MATVLAVVKWNRSSLHFPCTGVTRKCYRPRICVWAERWQAGRRLPTPAL